MITALVPFDAGRCRFPSADRRRPNQAEEQRFPPLVMLRIHGDRNSLLAALTAHWADQQLQIPQALRPVVGPITRSSRPKR
jgi:hypothetical protein